MFHWFTAGTGIFLTERVHAYRGRSTSHAVDDFADPDFPGARGRRRGPACPTCGAASSSSAARQHPIAEARTYRFLLRSCRRPSRSAPPSSSSCGPACSATGWPASR